MAGTSEGARKARETNKQKYGEEYYREIGSKSWKNPNRSHETGFALNKELAREAGRKGGLKTKNDYKTKEEDPLTILQEALRNSADLSE